MGRVRSSFARLEELESRLVLSPVPTPDHVVMVIEENQTYSDIIGSPNAPYINALANQGALFTVSYAIEHPSQPNYLDLFSGGNQGVGDDNCLASPLGAANLGSLLIAAGKTFGGYSESLPAVGDASCTSGDYARKHNPWSDFRNVPAADNMPTESFPANYSNLPTVAIVVPNLQNDMHDGTIAMGDTWLRNNVQPYINWATTHNSLFILTFDEDDTTGSNQIATIFVGPMVNPGQYSEYVNHYSVLRTLEDMYGLPYAGQSGSVNPITDVWVTAAPPDHFAVTTSVNPAIAGVPFDVTVTAQDVYGNTRIGYTGTVALSSADPQGATLPGNYRFTAADRGSHTFAGGAALYTAGYWDITARDSTSAATGMTLVAVNAGPAVMFTVFAPSAIASGTAFDVIIAAVDSYANFDIAYQGTVSWTSTDRDPRVRLPSSYTFQASDAGQVIFRGGVTLLTPGNQTITATDGARGITGRALVAVGSSGPQAGQGSRWDLPALAVAGDRNGRVLPADGVGASAWKRAARSSRSVALVDQCFTGTGEDSGWSWLGGPMAAAPSFILDPVGSLSLGMLVADQPQDPLAG